jgi:ribosomal-protein-alanine N-acetyltransferase
MPGGNSDTEIRLIDVGDADAIAARRARDADAFARWEPSRPADFSSADGQRERIEQLLDDHRNGDRWPGVALADGAVTGRVKLKLHRAEAHTQIDNLPSHGVLRKNGFTSYGIAHAHIFIEGDWRDEIFWERTLEP